MTVAPAHLFLLGGNHSGQHGPLHADASSRGDTKSPCWTQSLLFKRGQKNPPKQVAHKLMNTIFSFKLHWERN